VDLTLSRRGDYAVRSAVCLAWAYGSGRPKKLREISAEMGIPRSFVSQILGDLVRDGLAVPFHGKDGGYRLGCPPGEVSLLQVVEAAEGPLATHGCMLAAGPWREECPMHEAWSAAVIAFRSVLADTSLAAVAGLDCVIKASAPPGSPGAAALPQPAGPVAHQAIA
jgi:Rrf2 family protein